MCVPIYTCIGEVCVCVNIFSSVNWESLKALTFQMLASNNYSPKGIRMSWRNG